MVERKQPLPLSVGFNDLGDSLATAPQRSEPEQRQPKAKNDDEQNRSHCGDDERCSGPFVAHREGAVVDGMTRDDHQRVLHGRQVDELQPKECKQANQRSRIPFCSVQLPRQQCSSLRLGPPFVGA